VRDAEQYYVSKGLEAIEKKEAAEATQQMEAAAAQGVMATLKSVWATHGMAAMSASFEHHLGRGCAWTRSRPPRTGTGAPAS
jgi:hypothetical protein